MVFDIGTLCVHTSNNLAPLNTPVRGTCPTDRWDLDEDDISFPSDSANRRSNLMIAWQNCKYIDSVIRQYLTIVTVTKAEQIRELESNGCMHFLEFS